MAKGKVVNKKGQKEPTVSNKKGQISDMKESKSKTEVTRRSSLRRSGKSPDLLYDFIEDTPKSSNIAIKGNKMQNEKGRQKQKSTKNQIQTVTGKATKGIISARKENKTGVSIGWPKLVGDKKALVQAGRADNSKKHNVKKKIAPLPPPNFDEFSPIPMDSSKKRSHRSKKQEIESDRQQRRSRSASDKLSSNMPKFNLKDDETTFSDNDSAIFLSPAENLRKRSRAIEKSSTPIIPPKKSKLDNLPKILKKNDLVKNTSTPCESKPKMKTYTKLNEIEPECSPVQRTVTPTSDYASMDSIVVPSPSPLKPLKKKRGKSPTPAFSLEDNYEPEPLSLNRSINSNYSNQKTKKKKVKSSTYNDEKVEEWASKVNSELEDIENFELSVED